MSDRNQDRAAASEDAASRRRDGLLTTGDMARLSGSTLRTVRFYEEAGLLEPRQRTEGGHRLFARSELSKLTLVGDLRAAGLSLDDIKALLELKESAKTGADAVQNLTTRIDAQLVSIRERLEVLQRVQRSLGLARDIVTRCQSCTSSPLFPLHCGQCESMANTDSDSAVGVLWKLNRDDG
jgi:DNA-binding transcriptional MerR regulator